MAPSVVEPVAREAWTRRRRRAQKLSERYPFAGELLRLYVALLDVQEGAFLRAQNDRPRPATLPRYVADHVLGEVARATMAAGPPALAAAVSLRGVGGDSAALVAGWLAGERQGPIDGYLARAASGPVLEALGPAVQRSGRPAAGDCPRCGGLPQVSYLSEAGEALVSGPRMLVCSRCAASWTHQRMVCVGCGEQTTTKLPIFGEDERIPHLRADACESCRRYVITVDLRKDPDAVPIVDELVALPLDLYAQEHGFAKLVPNLMAIG